MVNTRQTGGVAAALLALLIAAPAGAHVRVEVDRDPVVADESFTVTFTSDAQVNAEPDFAPLEHDFDILQRSTRSSLQIINGRPDSAQSWVLTLIAKHSGKLELPAISFGNEHSDPLMLDVHAAASGTRRDDDVFITVEATPQPAYVQAQIIVKVRLYVGVRIGQASLSELEAPGAVVEKLGDDRHYDESRGGRDYTVYERRYAVFAERSATLTLSPVEFAGELMGRGYFGRYKRTSSDAMDLRIDPAPAGVVPWLPARELSLKEQWAQDPPVFHAGEPVTRTLTLTAKGLTAAQLPPLGGAGVGGFKQYADQPDLDDRVADDGVTGVRTEKIAFLPTQSGHYTLPAIELSWWNTQRNAPEIIRVPEREVDVLPGATSQPSAPAPTPAPASAAPAAAGPTPEQGATPSAAGTAPPWWIAAAVLLALGWLLTATAWWWSARRRRRRQRAALAPHAEAPALRAARQRLQAACAANDAAAAQNALLEWARARWPGAEGGAWQALVAAAGPDLARELASLARSRYGPGGETWSGAALWQRFVATTPAGPPSRVARPPALAPLHP